MIEKKHGPIIEGLEIIWIQNVHLRGPFGKVDCTSEVIVVRCTLGKRKDTFWVEDNH